MFFRRYYKVQMRKNNFELLRLEYASSSVHNILNGMKACESNLADSLPMLENSYFGQNPSALLPQAIESLAIVRKVDSFGINANQIDQLRRVIGLTWIHYHARCVLSQWI